MQYNFQVFNQHPFQLKSQRIDAKEICNLPSLFILLRCFIAYVFCIKDHSHKTKK